MRQNEAYRSHDMRRCVQPHFALDQGLADQTKFQIFEIAQAAMEQLAGARRRSLRKIVPLAEKRRKAATDRVAGEPGAVDAAPCDNQVELAEILHRRLCR